MNATRKSRIPVTLLLAAVLVLATSSLVAAQDGAYIPIVQSPAAATLPVQGPAPQPIQQPVPPQEPVDGERNTAVLDLLPPDGATLSLDLPADFAVAPASVAPDAYHTGVWYVQSLLGVGTDTPGGYVDVKMDGFRRLVATSPGGSPGWVTFAANNHRRDMVAWDGGIYFGASAGPGAPANNQFVIRENGNVGLGTLSPGGKLEINFGATGRLVAGTPVGEGPGYIYFAPNGHRRDINANNGGIYFGASTTAGAPGLGTSINLLENGYVGIGTSAPAAKLHVIGSVRVTGGSFIDDGVTLNVPDYVFEEGYGLVSLQDLSAYIASEQHLPGVPSRAEIKANGLNISAFTMTLLEKVEEQALYTLQQQESIEALELQVARQQQQVVELTALVNRLLDAR